MRTVVATVATVAMTAAVAQAPAPSAMGEVVKVDAAAGRVTIKHAGLRHLDMPPMAIAFSVANRALLEGVATGDRVRFVAERVDGRYTVTALTKAP